MSLLDSNPKILPYLSTFTRYWLLSTDINLFNLVKFFKYLKPYSVTPNFKFDLYYYKKIWITNPYTQTMGQGLVLGAGNYVSARTYKLRMVKDRSQLTSYVPNFRKLVLTVENNFNSTLTTKKSLVRFNGIMGTRLGVINLLNVISFSKKYFWSIQYLSTTTLLMLVNNSILVHKNYSKLNKYTTLTLYKFSTIFNYTTLI